MAQDYVDNVYDSTFEVQTTMANVEKNFAALKSSFSGAAAPSNPIAGMWWFDTAANILKLRNEANNAWQSVWDFANNKPVIANLSNEITNAMCAAALKDPAAATAGLRTLGTGATQAAAGNQAPPDGSVTGAKLVAAIAGNYQEGVVGTRSTTSTSCVKVLEFYIPRPGAYRFKMKLQPGWEGGIAYGRIYRNGGAVGTARSTTSQGGVVFSQDIAGWSVGNLCQLYLRTNNAASNSYGTLTICSGNPLSVGLLYS